MSPAESDFYAEKCVKYYCEDMSEMPSAKEIAIVENYSVLLDFSTDFWLLPLGVSSFTAWN